MTRRLFSAALVALLAAACSNRAADPDLQIGDAWARATAPGQTSGAAYMTIDNKGAADRLVAIQTSRATAATIHDSRTERGVMRMRMRDALPVPAGARVDLAPGGTHVMLAPLSAPLKAGETFSLTLRFERAGDMRVPVSVVAAGAR